MSLIATFYFVHTNIPGREVQFRNRSTGGAGLVYTWDFGDGITSHDVEPVHTYLTDGFYEVTLTVDDNINPVVVTNRYIGISATGIMLNQSIFDLIDNYLPTTVTLSVTDKQILIDKWQLYLCILVDPNIAEVDYNNEFAWPALVNELITELVAYDLIIQGANQFILGLSQSGTSGGSGQLKKVVTGPTEAEWFGSGDAGQAWNDIVKPGGALTQLINQICMLSHRLRIMLPICKPLSYSPTVPVKHPRTNTLPQSGNPFGIPDRY